MKLGISIGDVQNLKIYNVKNIIYDVQNKNYI
jgi:hypothetical protein